MSSPELSKDARRNREHGNAAADDYQARHGDFIGRPEPRWGVWEIAEDELQILGDVSVKDVLELGCGAAQWSILLAERGARPVGLDNSDRQLEHARAAVEAAGLDVPLVRASAEDMPLPDESFGLRRAEEDDAVAFQLPYGEWIRLLVRARLVVDALVEPQPAVDAASTYWDPSELEWARRWPSETIWKAR